IRISFIFVSILSLGLLPSVIAQQEKPKGQPAQSKKIATASVRASAAAGALRYIMRSSTPIPQYILNGAHSIAVISSYKDFGEFPNNEHGAGVVSARDPQTGKWSAPIFLLLKGGHIEQLLEDARIEDYFKTKDCVLFLLGMNRRTTELFLADELELGADVLVLPGSFGSVARPGTEVPAINVGFLAYVLTGEQVEGVSVAASSIRQDKELNDAVYEEKKLTSFIPTSDFIPGQVLLYPQELTRLQKAD
ncbi:MAG: YSC84-related protein, partial [Acidobacteriota bacterium]